MPDAVDLVRTYLQVNGYFTVVEYPVMELTRGEVARSVTDLDVLAVRFKGAGRVGGPTSGGTLAPMLLEPDPELGVPRAESDMIVAEVKEGHAQLNAAARDPRVLHTALVRFGCCGPDEVERVVQALLRRGQARAPHGHTVRLLAFGSTVSKVAPSGYRVISLGHVLEFLQAHLREHWHVARHAQIADPVLGFMCLLEKARQGTASIPDVQRP